ncbi:MAG: DUF2341 domain-containing protein [Thermoplasmatales archaeon]|nr:DUF2341 domain-containing protein [Thermoplasmatales archaeon]
MKKNHLLKKSGVVGIIVIFICASFVSSGYSEETTQVDSNIADVCELQENVVVTCYTFGFPGEPSQESTMSLDEAEFLYDKIKELQIEIVQDPLSDRTQQLQHEIITLADEHNLLPAGLSPEWLKSRLIQSSRPQHPRSTLPRLQGRASELFCNYISTGSGSSFPIIILPRLIPILLTPIPRLFVRWSTMDGITSCGGLRSGTGFIATGAQNGIALGFWGIGFSIFLPPVMAYGLLGYALFASVNAEEIELWPPNRPSVISDENPPSGTWNAPVSLSELSFRIEDADGDRMGYTVTTEPDIGSGSGNLKPNGVYTVPISDLEHDKPYRWTVEVTDGKETVEQQFSFITEGKPPFDPFAEGWQYRKEITIDHTKVAGDLTNFPVLVGTIDSDLSGKAQNDGDDILFMDGAGVATKLYHEIEGFDGSSGELVAWVNVPSVSGDDDTIFYMYYGNPSSSSQQFSEKVWDSDYEAVYHLIDKTSSNIEDSTINDNDGIKKSANNPVEEIGKIGNAQRFTEDYIDFTGLTSSAKSYTFSFWLKADRSTGDRSFWFDIEAGRLLFKWIDLSEDITLFDGGNHNYGDTPSANIWQHIVVVTDYNSDKSRLYLNGNQYGSELSYTAQNIGGTIKIGSRYEIHDGIDWFYWDGIIDETRISETVRSAKWIKTSYNNQNNPSSFLSFGPEETSP